MSLGVYTIRPARPWSPNESHNKRSNQLLLIDGTAIRRSARPREYFSVFCQHASYSPRARCLNSTMLYHFALPVCFWELSTKGAITNGGKSSCLRYRVGILVCNTHSLDKASTRLLRSHYSRYERGLYPLERRDVMLVGGFCSALMQRVQRPQRACCHSCQLPLQPLGTLPVQMALLNIPLRRTFDMGG